MKTAWTPKLLIDFELKVAQMFEAGQIACPVHFCGGNEESLVSIFEVINHDDWVFSTHRSHYHYLLKGGDKQALIDELQGLPSGVCGGKGRSMHLYAKDIRFFTSAIVGGGCAIAVGVALALKKQYPNVTEKRPHVWCFVGDGAEDSGHFVEAVRFGLSRALPLTFVIEDNDLGIDSTKKDRWHNYAPVESTNIMRYTYVRKYPHVGIGKHVSF
jgi:TPP-dependent pyruvate/acetoin dehydrogenase alpha subunit